MIVEEIDIEMERKNHLETELKKNLQVLESRTKSVNVGGVNLGKINT